MLKPNTENLKDTKTKTRMLLEVVFEGGGRDDMEHECERDTSQCHLEEYLPILSLSSSTILSS